MARDQIHDLPFPEADPQPTELLGPVTLWKKHAWGKKGAAYFRN